MGAGVLKNRAANGSKTVDKCFQVLQVISDNLAKENGRDLGMRLVDIATAADYDQATTYRYLQSLESFGLVWRDYDGRYRLGLKIVELYNVFMKNNTLRSVAYEYMVALSQETSETVYLGVLNGDEVSYIEKVDGPLPIRPHTPIGGRNKLYCTGLGKAMLSVADLDFVESIVNGTLEPATEHTILDPQQLLQELAECRKRGYAIDNMESQMDVRCVGAPIFNSLGQVFAAISVSGPAFRVTEERLEEMSHRVVEVAGKISQLMGYDCSMLRA
jgi:DNA-binding IclR family transcriptional regulator